MKYKTLFPALLFFISLPAFSQTKASANAVNDDDSVFTKPEIGASFPGGSSAWLKYISYQVMSNLDQLNNDNKPGTCYVQFIVDKKGKATDINVLTLKGSALARIAAKAIVKGPKWLPAQQNGSFVKSYVQVPVTFKSSQ